MKPILVLCLGNEVLSDDSFGFHIAQRLNSGRVQDNHTDVQFSSIAGFSLLDLLTERSRFLIIDSIQTGAAPGTLHFFPAGHLTPSQQLINSHQISLPTALALARQFGIEMPETIDVLAVEAQDVETLSESMTPAVAAAMDDAVMRVEDWIAHIKEELNTDVTRKKISAIA
jgi:hydrogenase maturation protease